MTLITYLTKAYRKAVGWFVTKRDNRIWEERLASKLKLFTANDHAWVTPVLQNEIAFIRSSFSNYKFDSSQQALQTDEVATMVFNATVYACLELVPLRGLVSIQPLQGPVGLVYRAAYKYQDPAVQDSQSLHLEVLKHAVEAKTHKLAARFNVEAAQDLFAIYGIDIADGIARALGAEVAYELIAEVLCDLNKIATHRQTVSGLPHDDNAIMINAVANTIASTTRRGAGNFIVTSPRGVALLQSVSKSGYVKTPDSEQTHTYALRQVGTLNGQMRVYVSMVDMNDSSPNIEYLIGYKGPSDVDAGYVFSPYNLVVYSGATIDPNTYTPMINLMTRYGKTGIQCDPTTSSESADYYGVVTVEDVSYAVPVPAVDLPAWVRR